MDNKTIILVGGGGHCESVMDVAESAGYSILGILERPEEVGKKVLGHEVIGTDDDMVKYVDVADFIITVGQIKSPVLRIKLHEMVKEVGGRLATIVSPTAHVSKYAKIGAGTVVMHQAVVNANATIGRGCIINTFANIEHDVVIGDYCHISTGAMINGEVRMAEGVFVGSQSVINQCVSICQHTIIGSGSVVNRNIIQPGIYQGNPIKLICKGNN